MRHKVSPPALCLLLLTVVLLGSSPPLRAWEEDLHYGLTRWLVVEAGFSPADAELIAANDQMMDDSNYLNAITASFHIVVFEDAGAAEMVGLHHFPNPAGAPNPPRLRVVVPDSIQARTPAEDAIHHFNLQYRTEGLRRFGLALHTLQDSWAHQGEPGIPFSPYWEPWPNGEWGHPEARGGWYVHDADETFRFPLDAIATAHETYNLLCQFLVRHPQLRERKSASWASLQPRVMTFARARTKQAKLAWFADDPRVPLARYGKCDFLNHISILDGSGWVPQCTVPKCYPKVASSLPTGSDIRSVVERFLVTWIMHRSIGMPWNPWMWIKSRTSSKLKARVR